MIGRLLDVLPAELAPGRRALLEIGADQADRVAALATDRLPGWPLSIHSDLGGQPRVAELERRRTLVPPDPDAAPVPIPLSGPRGAIVHSS